MINRKHRFHGRGSLRFVYQRGKTLRGPLASIKFIANPRRTEYRLAVVVSRKVHKSAVVRNRIRRRVYEAARQYESQFLGAYDIVITIFSDQVAEIESAELHERLTSKLVEAGIMPAKASVPEAEHAIVNAKE